MTPKNILSGFHRTGIYPPNRNAIILPEECDPGLAQETAIAYIPHHTPTKKRIMSEEEDDFQLCYEESGTWNLGSSWYQEWIRKNHSTSVVSDGSYVTINSSLRPFLITPKAPRKDCTSNSSRVDQLRRIEE